MNIQTNFNEEIKEHLDSLIGKKLREIIFFRENLGSVFTANFSSLKNNNSVPFYAGERLALIFRMPEDNLASVVLSFKYNNQDMDCYLIDNRFGCQIWNIDFHYETFYKERLGPRVKRIEEVELYKFKANGAWKPISPFTRIPFSQIPVSKIEVFGMKEYFEDITKVDFESMSYSSPAAFKLYEYPIDVNIITYIVVSLSENAFLFIDVTSGGLRVCFCNEEQIQVKYEFIKNRKNAFNRPFAKLLYTTEV